MNTPSDHYDTIYNALQEFRKQTNESISGQNFDPAKITKQLTDTLREQNIDITEIFCSPEDTEKLLMDCIHTDIEQLHTDQLYHALTGSTRTPYHHLNGILKDNTSEHHTTIDTEKLARLLVTYISI